MAGGVYAGHDSRLVGRGHFVLASMGAYAVQHVLTSFVVKLCVVQISSCDSHSTDGVVAAWSARIVSDIVQPDGEHDDGAVGILVP